MKERQRTLEKLDYLATLPSLLVAPEFPILHRDLSWLQFNERVLEEARNPNNPTLERIKFLGITSSNLDEFFGIRFASHTRPRLGTKVTTQGVTTTAKRIEEITRSILESVTIFISRQIETLEVLTATLEDHGIRIIRELQKHPTDLRTAQAIFNKKVLPFLPEPVRFRMSEVRKLKNLQACAVWNEKFALPIPFDLPGIFYQNKRSTGEMQIFFLDDLLLQFLPNVFKIEENFGILRLTRDGDFSVDLENNETDAVPQIVEKLVRKRDSGRPMRIQYQGNLTQEFLNFCAKSLKLSNTQLFAASGSVFLHQLTGFASELVQANSAFQHLMYPRLKPLDLRHFKSAQIFETLKKKDMLLHQPYDSFESYLRFIRAAANDPDVTCIEQTIYRMDKKSPLIDLLKIAAKHGKTVRVFIEPRARFDEIPNLQIAEEFSSAGIEVYFGFGKLKLHAKIAMITRKESDQEIRYVHLSTGNYNSKTAKQYTDLSIFTAHEEIGQDARHFFDSVMQKKVPSRFRQLLAAPLGLHRKLLNSIKQETKAARDGHKARIIAKVNALVDDQVIEHLYLASQAGVQVDLIVRGACSLVPGVRGLSENIRVVSVVDRFLEHSRIYYFGHAHQLYMSSADWMPRNFFSRLELAFPALDDRIYDYLVKVLLSVYLVDTEHARELTPLGTWKRRTKIHDEELLEYIHKFTDQKRIRSQFFFAELARKKYRKTPLE